MLDSIQHRGPDGAGQEVNDAFSIGMKRLAIIDPRGGCQPIYNEDNSLDFIKDIFSSQKFAERGLYNQDRVIEMFDKWLNGHRGDGLIFWRILVTELWMKRYIDVEEIKL